MFYVYIIQSLTHNTRYVESTDNVTKRLSEHNKGKCRYTKGRGPWKVVKVVYEEKFLLRSEAMIREKFLKTGQGRKVINDLVTRD